ncbi:MAG TPA: glutamine amidotransferase [Rhodobacter sp.]|nr:glutamine amidotransferase [Rhodobacter sp.]
MRIGILQTGIAPDSLKADFGDYPAFFETLLTGNEFEFTTYVVVNNDFPPDVQAADGWLITGSRHGAYENHAFITPLEDFIRSAAAGKVPMVGVCFGHQIMAQALGGKVEKFIGGWSVGANDYDFEGQTVTLNAWHQDQVTSVPKGAKIIAHSPFCAVAGLAYGTHGLSVQAHPEFSSEFVEGLMDSRGKGVVPEALLSKARTRLNDKIDQPLLARKIADFFKKSQTL